jgi:TATA-binding protein-associated factor Taf7
MSTQPDIGEWYRIRGGEPLEVVAIDEDDGTVEVQYFDGTLEELDLADWKAQRTKGEIEDAEAPEDWSGSADVEGDEDTLKPNARLNGDPQLAGGLDDLDLFESTDFESPDIAF